MPLDARLDAGLGPARGLDEFSPYPPIADYAFLSDCEVTALVAPSGAVEWMCLPRLDCPSVFGAILDRDAGRFRFGPERHGRPGRPALPAGHDGPGDQLGLRRGLDRRAGLPGDGPVAARAPGPQHAHRPPTDYDAEHMLLRTVRCVHGTAQLTHGLRAGLRLRPRARPAGGTPTQGYYQATIGPPGADLTLTLTSDIRIGLEGPSARSRTLLKEGETRFCALSWGSRGRRPTTRTPTGRLVWTAHHWQHWLARGGFPDHRWRSYLARSALTLKGLTFAPTGAIAAAATTSLPETPRGERNWDYRYSWIRDATFALWGLFTLGFEWEASDYFAFLDRGGRAGRRQPADRLRHRRPRAS